MDSIIERPPTTFSLKHVDITNYVYFKSYRLFRLRPGKMNEEVCGRVQSCAAWMGTNCDDNVDGPWYCFKWHGGALAEPEEDSREL